MHSGIFTNDSKSKNIAAPVASDTINTGANETKHTTSSTLDLTTTPSPVDSDDKSPTTSNEPEDSSASWSGTLLNETTGKPSSIKITISESVDGYNIYFYEKATTSTPAEINQHGTLSIKNKKATSNTAFYYNGNLSSSSNWALKFDNSTISDASSVQIEYPIINQIIQTIVLAEHCTKNKR